MPTYSLHTHLWQQVRDIHIAEETERRDNKASAIQHTQGHVRFAGQILTAYGLLVLASQSAKRSGRWVPCCQRWLEHGGGTHNPPAFHLPSISGGKPET
ncbi:hypothetical protein BaRGS_00030318 [Batillaria attramentaria]|uniref:Uncharacterized protein n=1 Tax=Batillaria attramentaria TaxID=370345 RepID=A0ABD0JUZ4_9CAEN